MSVYRINEKVVCSNKCRDLREHGDVLIRRMSVLKLPERRFMELAYYYGMSVRHISMITGLSSRTVLRRLGHIRKLLVGGSYVRSVLGARDVSGQQKEIAYDLLVKGIGYRRLAVRYKMSQYQARKTIRQLRQMANGTVTVQKLSQE